MKIFRLLIWVLFPLNIICAQAQNTEGVGIRFIHENFTEAISQAKRENKLIFMDAYTTWCGPCKSMSKNVFPDGDVAALYNSKFINLEMDMEQGQGSDLVKRYEVTAFPTLLFIDGDGKLVHKAIGFHDIEGFIELGKTALDTENSLSAWILKYEKGNREASFLKEYAIKLQAANDKESFKIAEEYLATQTDWKTEPNIEFIYRFTEGVDSKMFDFLLKNKSAFSNVASASEVEAKIQNLVAEVLMNEKKLPSLEYADALINKIYGNQAAQTSKKYRMSYYRMKGDRDNYAKAAVDYFKKYDDSAEELSDVASVFSEQIEDKKMLKKAAGWAKKAIKLDDSYLNNLTLANLYKSLNKNSKAIQAAKKAIEVAKKSTEPFSEAEELIKMLGENKK